MRGWLSRCTLALALVGAPAGALAQGWGMVTQSACAVGRGGAGVGAPCADGSAILLNPAALAFQQGIIGVGVAGIRNASTFSLDDQGGATDTEGATLWRPYGYFNYNVTPRMSAAIGVFTPYAQNLDWPSEFEGRYIAHRSLQTAYYLQPTVAFALTPRLSLGVGADVVFANLGLDRRLDLAGAPIPMQPGPGPVITFGDIGLPSGIDYADVQLTGRGTGLTFHVAGQAKIGTRLSLGARYMHWAAVDLDGDADFSPVQTNLVLPEGNALSRPANPFGFPVGAPVQLDPLLSDEFFVGGRLEDQTFTTSLKFPAQLAVGAAFTALPGLQLLADYQWTGSADYDDLTIVYEGRAPDSNLILDFENTATYRAGLEYEASSALDLRAGYSISTAAADDNSVTPVMPDARQTSYSAGAAWDLGPRMRIDVAYGLVNHADRRGRVRSRDPELSGAALEALNEGTYSSSGSVLTATFSLRFGAAR